MKFTTLQLVFGSIIVGAFVSLIAMLMFFQIPAENKDAVSILIGAIAGSFTTVVAYYFGSSKGSADKNAHIKNLTDK